MLTKQDSLHGARAYLDRVPSAPVEARAFPRGLHLWLLTFSNLALIAVVLVLIRGSLLPDVAKKDPPAELAKEEKAEIDIDALNPYGQAIAKLGLTGCAAAMNDVSRTLLQGKRVGVYRFPTVHETFVSLSMEVNSAQGTIIYVTFNLSQDTNGSCQIAYEAVSDWANPCDDVIKTVFKDFESTRPLLKSVSLLANKDNKNRKIFTMPVQSGCIAIEKQVISTKR